MQNHLEIQLKIQFWTRNVSGWIKTLTLDMSGPAKTCPGGQILTANQRKYFYFSDLKPFHLLLHVLGIFENHVFY